MSRFLFLIYSLFVYVLGAVFAHKPMSFFLKIMRRLLEICRDFWAVIHDYAVFALLVLVLIDVGLRLFPISSFNSFWENFLANLFAGSGIAGLVGWMWKRSKRVGLKLDVAAERLGDSEVRLTFSVDNSGEVSFKSGEIYWHVYIPDGVKINKYNGADRKSETVELFGKKFKSFRSLLSGPAFMRRQTGLFSLKIESYIEKQEIYYLFSTVHGEFPSRGTKSGGSVLGKIELLPLPQ